jgi:uncharacterized protein (TIGR04255 family)
MSESEFHLGKAPIIEAVLDIDCVLPTSFKLEDVEVAARDSFRSEYPKLKKQFLLQHSVKHPAEGPAEVSGSRALQALQFLKDDEKQLIQLRRNGFSFNRLTPYDSLDTYLPEIESTWHAYQRLVSPSGIRRIALRYINRLLLPVDGGKLRLSDYLRQAPQLPEETKLSFTGFLHQHQAVESGTGNKVAIIIASQPVVNDELPVILDITASKDCRTEPSSWEEIEAAIRALRGLKNQVFKQSLTQPCLNRYLPQPS